MNIDAGFVMSLLVRTFVWSDGGSRLAVVVAATEDAAREALLRRFDNVDTQWLLLEPVVADIGDVFYLDARC
jgi:hypothetical protein